MATGGLNAVVCDIPARDLGEFASFPEHSSDNRSVSIDFYHAWFKWAADNAALLRRTQFLPSPPGSGVIDGTYMTANNSGYIFLFNPYAEALATPPGLLTASDSLGLDCVVGDSFIIGEMWPIPTTTVAVVACGANFSIDVEARNARVLTITQASRGAPLPTILPTAVPLFVHSQPVVGMAHSPSFAGGALRGTVRVPQAALDQLVARGSAYPVPWSASDDLPIAWLAPHRLLLHVHVNRALKSDAALHATLNSTTIPVQPVWSCRNVRADMCFQGFFIDLTAAGVAAETNYELVLQLPAMSPGAFGGVYYEVRVPIERNRALTCADVWLVILARCSAILWLYYERSMYHHHSLQVPAPPHVLNCPPLRMCRI